MEHPIMWRVRKGEIDNFLCRSLKTAVLSWSRYAGTIIQLGEKDERGREGQKVKKAP